MWRKARAACAWTLSNSAWPLTVAVMVSPTSCAWLAARLWRPVRPPGHRPGAELLRLWLWLDLPAGRQLCNWPPVARPGVEVDLRTAVILCACCARGYRLCRLVSLAPWVTIQRDGSTTVSPASACIALLKGRPSVAASTHPYLRRTLPTLPTWLTTGRVPGPIEGELLIWGLPAIEHLRSANAPLLLLPDRCAAPAERRSRRCGLGLW